MSGESVVWTVLPNGCDEKGWLQATIFVSPRLTTGDGPRPLSDFPTFSEWASVVQELQFDLEDEAAGGVGAERDTRIAAPNADRWKLFFGNPKVMVVGKPFEELDLSLAILRSFPAGIVADSVLDLYSEVASKNLTTFPSVNDEPLKSLASEIGGLSEDPSEKYLHLDSLLAQESNPALEGRSGRYLQIIKGDSDSRKLAFAALHRFYNRPAGLSPNNTKIQHEPPLRPELDFHNYLAALADYPYLLRQLGIAIDLRFPPDMLFADEGRIRVALIGDAQEWMTEEGARPWTNYVRNNQLFLPKPRQAQQARDGQLHLKSGVEGEFAIHQIDIDGSAFKTLGVAHSARNTQAVVAKGRSMTPDSMSLPALRTTGFTLVKHNRAAGTVAIFDQSVLHHTNETNHKPADLFAEDVTRGYRLDIAAGTTGKFQSQCYRVGQYVMKTADGDVLLDDVPSDEGYIKGASTTSVPGYRTQSGKRELYLHEAVLSWGGWSLVAKPPSQYFSPDEQVTEEKLEVDATVPLVTAFRPVRGSLTRLRYGESYRFRVLLVDLAGNSVKRDAIDDSQASSPEKFLRWEPVNAPAVLRIRDYTEGESQLRMVIRSTLGMDTATYLTQPRIASLAAEHPNTAYLAYNDRWLAAPKTSVQMAEWHGMFDAATFNGAGTAAVDQAFEVACRESGSLDEVIPDTVNKLKLPYLPDVSSRGVALTGLPTDPAGHTRSYAWPVDDLVTAAWWDRQPIRIRIVEGPAAPPVTPGGPANSAEFAAGILTVFLPQAEMITLQVASAIDASDLNIQGLWHHVKAALPDEQHAHAASSRSWMFTPWHELTLVHAVERPLLAPVIQVPQAGMQRELGETFCALVGDISNHAKSTGRIDVEATWTPQVDDPSDPEGPRDGEDGRNLGDAGYSHVGDFNLLPTEDECLVGRDDEPTVQPPRHKLRHELGDTKHRIVTYRANATTRFREYFAPEINEGKDASGQRLIEHKGPDLIRHVPSSRRPEPPEIDYVIPTWTWTKSTHTRAPVGGRGRIIAARNLDTQTRSGGGLRVYLKRGWYSSGDGELLGVVIADQPWLTWSLDQNAGMLVNNAELIRADQAARKLIDSGAITVADPNLSYSEQILRAAGLTQADIARADSQTLADLASGMKAIEPQLGLLSDKPSINKADPQQFTTRWGLDPVWGSALPASGPFIHQLPHRVAVQTQVPLQECAATVTVVGHKPRYDAQRGLWYCDIQANAGSSYTPFIRLALCRYQPWSIPGAHISSVVLADFAQLLPRRRAAFTRLKDSVEVSVSGPGGYTINASGLAEGRQGAAGDRLSRRLTATHQFLKAQGDPDLDWADAGPEVQLDLVSQGALDAATWSATVPLSGNAGSRQRILVREYELLTTDNDPDDPLGACLSAPPSILRRLPVRQRIVYADTYQL